jgi:hypothetical protein
MLKRCDGPYLRYTPCGYNVLMPTHHLPASAADLKVRLEALQIERAAAALNGLGGNGLYMADLDDDVRATRAAFTGRRGDRDRPPARGLRRPPAGLAGLEPALASQCGKPHR